MYISKNIDPLGISTIPDPTYTGLFFDLSGALNLLRSDGSYEPISVSRYISHPCDGTLTTADIGKGVAFNNNGIAVEYQTSKLFFGTLIDVIAGTTAIIDPNLLQVIKLDASSPSALLGPQTDIVYVNIINGGTVVLSLTSNDNIIGMYIYDTYDSINSTIKFKVFTPSDLIFIERSVDIISLFNGAM